MLDIFLKKISKNLFSLPLNQSHAKVHMAPEERLSAENMSHCLIDLSVFFLFIMRTNSLNGSAKPADIKNNKPAANIVLRKQMINEVVFS